MEKPELDDIVTRLDSIELILARLEKRLGRLEKIEGVTITERSEQPSMTERVADSAPGDIRFDFTLIGRSFFALAGAYLLRAATESRVIPAPLGVALGLAYALMFLMLAWRAASRGARPSASFHGGIALLVGLPLIAEAVIRFELLSSIPAAALISMVAASSFVVCFKHRMKTLSWLTVLATLGTLVVVMFRTHEMLPHLWVLLALVVTTRRLSKVTGQHLVWPVAILGDALVLVLADVFVSGHSPHSSPSILLYLAMFFTLFAGGALARAILEGAVSRVSEMTQVSFATLFTMASGARIAATGADGGTAFELFALLVGITVAILSLRLVREGTPGRNARYWSTLGVLLTLGAFAMFTSGMVLAALATIVAITLLIVAQHFRGSLLEFHAVIALSLATGASSLAGLVLAALAGKPEAIASIGVPSFVLLALTLAVAVIVREAGPNSHWTEATAKVMAIVLTVLCSAGVLITIVVSASDAQRGAVAMIRTGSLVAAAIALAAFSRIPRLRSARVLVYPVLLFTAAKLVFEDFRVGSPATLFVALALYGAALIFAPRLRWKGSEVATEASA